MKLVTKKVKALTTVIAAVLLLAATAGCDGLTFGSKPSASKPNNDHEDKLPYRIETVAENLNVPWAIDISSDGKIFFTERPGTVRVIEKGQLRKEPVITFSSPFASEGEGGLLGLALDPDYRNNHYIYVYHSYRENERIYNRVIRLVERNNKAVIDRVLLSGIPGEHNHNGGRIKIGPDRRLYITAGDAWNPDFAQDRNSLAGKILRIKLDGSIPDDNPIPGSPVYSWGHRNPQGLAWNAAKGIMFSSEHGQSALDEINVIQKGANYGWPVIEGDEGHSGEPAMLKPILHSGEETWAPSGIAYVDRGPWKGKLLVANLRGEQLLSLSINDADNKVTKVEKWFQSKYGRLREVVQAPDGSLYIATNNKDGRGVPSAGDDRIIKLVPVKKQ